MAQSHWCFMRIWLDPLRARLSLFPRSEDLTAEGRSIFCGAVDLSRCRDFRALGEALVILAMLARIDFSAFKNLIIDYCELDDFCVLEASEDENFLPVSFQILIKDFAFRVAVGDILAFLSGFDDPPNTRFIAAARKISTSSSQIVALPNPLDITIAISIENRYGGEADTIENLQHVLLTIRNKHGDWRIPMEMSTKPNDLSVIPCAVCLGPIQLDISSKPLKLDVAEKIGQIMSGGDRLPVNNIVLYPGIEDDGTIDDAVEAQVLGKLYQQILREGGYVKTWPTFDNFTATFVHEARLLWLVLLLF